MSTFGDYSNYYDLLYKDKDYEVESKYISNLIKKYDSSAKSILDLGCGTGKHDYILSDMGYFVTGIDFSSSMIEIAKAKENDRLKFYCDNICEVSLNKTFDAIVSLFHVISYQVSNESLINAFKTAYKHLKENGIFIFDCWYGPAVLTKKPEVRVKRLENQKIQVCRIAEPVLYPNENIVDVNYDVLIKNKEKDYIKEIKEVHRMRYLFKPEIVCLLSSTGFKMVDCFEFMTDKEPGCDTWGVCFVVRKI